METTKKTKEMDMLNGGLAGKLILFSIPLAFSSILRAAIQFGGCRCSWKICRRQGISSSRKLCSVSWYFCKPDRGIFRRTECSVSKSDRTETKR